MSSIEDLSSRIASRTATVGVIGLGYVGLPLAMEAARAGFAVTGVDTNTDRVSSINAGVSQIGDVSDSELSAAISENGFSATSDLAVLSDLDIVVICVPTPLTRHLAPNLTSVVAAATSISKVLRRGHLVILESTTYPGTTDEVLRPIFERQAHLTVGSDYFLAYSPERVDPGNSEFSTQSTTKVVGADDEQSLKLATAFYESFVNRTHSVSSASVAEMSKVFENTFRAVNIGLVNEMALLCDRMGLDVWEVLDAANTKPFGIMPFYPGPGVGGHCIPLDPHYLEWRAREYGFQSQFIAAAGETNRSMPSFVEGKIGRILNSAGVATSNSKIHVLGVSYKRDVSDERESPATHCMELLLKGGAQVSYSDPFVPETLVGDVRLQHSPVTQDVLENADVTVLLTDHSAFDMDFVVAHCRSLFDTRGVTRASHPRHPKITLL